MEMFIGFAIGMGLVFIGNDIYKKLTTYTVKQHYSNELQCLVYVVSAPWGNVTTRTTERKYAYSEVDRLNRKNWF